MWIALAVFAIACVLLTGLYRYFALRYAWLDAPNQRSSHRQVTPRGAGIVFAILIVAAACWARRFGPLSQAAGWSLVFATGIALLGWYDDIRQLSARYRFIGYWLFTLCALAFVYLDAVATYAAAPLLLALLLCSAALQWLINLYNFMDGINGIAALEAVFVLSAISLLAAGTPFAAEFGWLLGTTVALLLAFLCWNFPRAQVFMGDAGSAFLGFVLGVLLTWSHFRKGPDVVIWLILLGVFTVDATYTLLVRIATGQVWHQAHRLHAYQILARRWDSHSAAVGVLMSINLVWLLPWAWLAQRHTVAGEWALFIAYTPLLAGCCAVGAGQPREGRV